jgi:hypothetical protein
MNLRFSPAISRLAGYLKDLLHTALPIGTRSRVLGPLLVMPWLISGCTSYSVSRHSSSPSLPPVRQDAPPDRFAAQCGLFWQKNTTNDINDVNYWLHAMQCAERMTPSQARLDAADQDGDTWDDAFRESILLNSASITVAERRQTYQRLLEFRSQFPASVYPLFKMWRQQQALRLILADERAHSQRQQEAAAAQIDQLRQQQMDLQHKLDITTRKLENLTEIERRLSARKQGMPDNSDNDASEPSAAPNAASSTSSAAGEKTAPAVKP